MVDLHWPFDLHRSLTPPLDEKLWGFLVVDDGEPLCLTICLVKAAVERALSFSWREAESGHRSGYSMTIKQWVIKNNWVVREARFKLRRKVADWQRVALRAHWRQAWVDSWWRYLPSCSLWRHKTVECVCPQPAGGWSGVGFLCV